jgi:hypothetical protein
MQKMIAPIVAFAIILGLAVPLTAHAEIITVPPAAPADPAASPPLPTVLRGSPAATAAPAPSCPPGYILSSAYGCIGPNGGDYTEATPSYDYWPDYGFGYPFDGFGFTTNRNHRFGFHGGRRFHHRAGFHGSAKSDAAHARAGHMGGFGRR